jgi:hypothetical protein
MIKITIFKKIANFSRKSPFFQENRHFLKKIAIFSRKSPFFQENCQFLAMKIFKVANNSARNGRKSKQLFLIRN